MPKNSIIIKSVMETKKKFDCVKMMRDIRDKIDAETAHMTFEELRAHLDKQLEHDAFWQRIIHQQKEHGCA